MKAKRVLIENPPGGCSNRTTVNRARRHVKKGRAEWVQIGLVIRFLDTRQQASVKAEAARTHWIPPWTRQQDGDYDGIQRLMRIHELRNLPAVGKVERAYY